MRLAIAALAVCLAVPATPAAADRAASYGAYLVGADADTIGVIVKHDTHGWTMKVRPRPGDEPVEIATPGIPATHGDYLVFVGPGRTKIAWVMTGDVQGAPAAGDAVVWVFKVDDGSVVTTTFAQLFTDADRDKLPQTSSGTSWYPLKSTVKPKGHKLSLPAIGGGTVVVDLKAGTVKRKRK